MVLQPLGYFIYILISSPCPAYHGISSANVHAVATHEWFAEVYFCTIAWHLLRVVRKLDKFLPRKIDTSLSYNFLSIS